MMDLWAISHNRIRNSEHLDYQHILSHDIYSQGWILENSMITCAVTITEFYVWLGLILQHTFVDCAIAAF